MRRLRPVSSILFNNSTRFLTMMVALLLLFVLYPFLGNFSTVSIFSDIFFTLILLSGVFALSEHKKLRVFTVVLAVVTLACGWGNNFFTHHVFQILSAVLYLFFFSTVAISILIHVLNDEEITSEKIYGAIAVYFFIGLIWALLYGLIEIIHPGSFSAFSKSMLTTKASVKDGSYPLLYYSLITLTTVGYGDIVPATPAARVLSALEAVIGQLYLTVLIARLVGLHIAYGKRKKQDN